MPVQRPYNPNARRIAKLMQADLAKTGVKAEIKSFEWGEYRRRLAKQQGTLIEVMFDSKVISAPRSLTVNPAVNP